MEYYDLLKQCGTINSDRYQNQIVELKKWLVAIHPEWTNRYGKIILLHYNALIHTSKGVESMLKDLSWEES